MRSEQSHMSCAATYRAVMLSHGTKPPARGLPPMPTPISLPSHTSGCGVPLLCKVPSVCPHLTGYGIPSRDRRPPSTRGETRPPPARGLMRWPCSSSSPTFRHRVVVISHCLALQACGPQHLTLARLWAWHCPHRQQTGARPRAIEYMLTLQNNPSPSFVTLPRSG